MYDVHFLCRRTVSGSEAEHQTEANTAGDPAYQVHRYIDYKMVSILCYDHPLDMDFTHLSERHWVEPLCLRH